MSSTLSQAEFLEVGELARRLGVSVSAVQKWEKLGQIPAAQRTAGGRRIYTPTDVETIRVARQARRSQRPAGAA